MDSKERRQRKYLRQMLNRSVREHNKFDKEVMKETHKKLMEKNKKYGDTKHTEEQISPTDRMKNTFLKS